MQYREREHSGARRGEAKSIRNTRGGITQPYLLNAYRKSRCAAMTWRTDGTKKHQERMLSSMRLRLLSWMRSLDEASLKRVADATRWNYACSRQDYANEPVCLVCHATGNDYRMGGTRKGCMVSPHNAVWPMDEHAASFAEQRYIWLAARHGNEKAGRVMQRLARGILARRALAEMPQESRTLEAVRS